MQNARSYAGLHRDGVFGVTNDVPARVLRGVGEKGVGAGNIFFRMDFVDLEFRFATFIRDGQKASTVDGTGGFADTRKAGAELEPESVDEINRQEQGERET